MALALLRHRAASLDASSPTWRQHFHVPRSANSPSAVYLCGNSLGLQPKGTKEKVDAELERWAQLGVEGHFTPPNPWVSIEETCVGSMARLVGAKTEEIVVMNSLTVNLHLMMVSFYRPRGDRTLVLMEKKAFPSDTYAIRSHVKSRGLDPDDHIVFVEPKPNAEEITTEDVVEAVQKFGSRLALVVIGGVNYYSGAVFDLERVARVTKGVGAMFGVDLAHAVGNVPLSLHEWECDFAVWCTYKYLNAGPGGIGAAFVHEKHHNDTSLDLLAGWWGTQRSDRFAMKNEFQPWMSAARWQLSNPPVLQTVALRASLDVFDGVESLPSLFNKSRDLTSFLQESLEAVVPGDVCRLLIPKPQRFEKDGEGGAPRYSRGCQISLLFLPPFSARRVHGDLAERGVICDLREPDVVRISPVPLYNTFTDVVDFVEALAGVVEAHRRGFGKDGTSASRI